MKALEKFKKSPCSGCGYCAEKGTTDEDLLDVRGHGVIKIWCHAAGDTGDVVQLAEGKKEDCYHRLKADNE